MKSLTGITLSLAFASILLSCNPPKTEETEAEMIVADTLKEEVPQPVKILTVEGKVKGVTQGKDGYTAEILTNANESYFLTISIPNLKDPKQYKAVKAGDHVKVSGESWKLEMDNYITVREIL